ncbi:O-antigen ligase family protein [Pseudoalteromonas shioyasakiensis]|uniref:O-antigen ligase family protein n=1 Tax=Pseudoalteromonas shioyasakiensis TaxID=1190813 RepID=UPI00211887FF|nr:O-antigen ligase family protein [Pseudoalteromonas shioyasakiensis]MCQ8876501.1 O-antigen ligase family protein [Pseudoalteromonas shioyasakiensis]
MNKLIFYMLCVLIFLLPIPLGSFRPWAIMTLGFLLTSVFTLHLANSLFFSRRLLPPVFSWPIFSSLLCVITLCSIQTLTVSIDTQQTNQMLIKTTYMLILCWLLFVYCDSKQKVKILLYTITLTALCQSLYASFLNLTPSAMSPVFGYQETGRALGSFSYANFLANYLMLSLSLGIGLFISQLNNKPKPSNSKVQLLRDFTAVLLSPKIAIRIALIIIIVALILTRSRMGNSAFFISLTLISLIAVFIYKNKPPSFKYIILSFFIVDVIIIGALFDVERIKERITETSLHSESRDEVVRDAIPLILDKPFIGSGGGTFYTAFPAYQSEPYSGYYDNAHNDYIQFAVELGLPATLILGILVLYCFWLCLNTMKTRKTSLYQGTAFGCAIAITAMLLHSTVDYSLQAGANSMLFIIILCLTILTNKLPPPVHSYK